MWQTSKQCTGTYSAEVSKAFEYLAEVLIHFGVVLSSFQRQDEVFGNFQQDLRFVTIGIKSEIRQKCAASASRLRQGLLA